MNYQIKRAADNVLSGGDPEQLYALLSDQFSRTDALMQDNALLQRAVHKYESTYAELDSIFRQDDRDRMICDLRRLADKQVNDIVNLQRELEYIRNKKQYPC